MAFIVFDRYPLTLQPRRRWNPDCGHGPYLPTMEHILDRVCDRWTMLADVPRVNSGRMGVQDEKSKRPGEQENASLVNADSKNCGLRVELDASQFNPEEIQARVQGDLLRVEAEHREEVEGRKVYRRMVQELSLPPGTDPRTIQSRLTKDGVLMILAPPAALEREVPILMETNASKEDDKDVEKEKGTRQEDNRTKDSE